jgi:uncharacterized protein YcbK (DUF882 family)
MRCLPALIVALGLVVSTGPVFADGMDLNLDGPIKPFKKKKGNSQTQKGTTTRCTGSGAEKKCQKVATFQGHGVWTGALRTEDLVRPSGEVWVFAENLNEEVKVNIYKTDGSFDDAALAKLDELWRCPFTGEVRAVRTQLYEQLSRFYDHFGQKRIELVSGFRFAERDSSRHHHASAMDIRIPGISVRQMYKYAESLDLGDMGIGIYPVSGFIHVDYRAPGERSYRWTDYSGNSARSRTQRARKPTS